MTIAFYSPLKSPRASTPSGDRQIARNLIAALERGGMRVDLASELRSFEGAGDADEQNRIRFLAGAEAARIIKDIRLGKRSRPDLWLTYHVYHKAPDWIGSVVAADLDIPYVIVEASISPRQTRGKWSLGHDAACACVAVADIILALNPRDGACVRPRMKSGASYELLPPFIDTQVYQRAAASREHFRTRFEPQGNADGQGARLLAVGMMREGDKFQSYVQLADALRLLHDEPWHLFVAGDGAAREAVREKFSVLDGRVTWLGEKSPPEMAEIYAAMDILTWPAVNEALGMVFLEAGASGLPVVAGHTDGVASLVQDGTTGIVVPQGNTDAFAAAIRCLIEDPGERARISRNAGNHILRRHDLDSASRSLVSALRLPVSGRSS